MTLDLQTETLERPLTLTSIMPTVRRLPVLDKLKLIRVLAEDVEREGDIFPFETRKTYQFPTPYETYGAAEILLEGLAAYDENGVQ